MKKRQWALAAVAAASSLALMVPTGMANAATPAVSPQEPDRVIQRDDLGSPMSDKQRALHREALDRLAAGTATLETNSKGKRVINLGKGRYVNYDVERQEAIFTILVEFGDQTMTPQGGTPGPLHNQIPKPDRAQDNSTIWTADFNTAHYQQMMFGQTQSFKDFYLKQSNGRFLAKGDVSAWVKLPYNEARYGHNPVKGDGTTQGSGYWNFVKDAVTAWYDSQKAAGKTDAQIKAYLSQFDNYDRYDFNGNGVFNESDGYIDHIQVIHAGAGEEAGGGAQGTDAIWSHRWYAFSTDAGKTGPEGNKLGGTPIGNSGLWVGDYTTEPENGGLGVFVHEFGHDLGLPDLYDTNGGDNGTGFWTLMSAGSWLNHNFTDIGSSPGYMGPWEKVFLGWADIQSIPYGKNTKTTLGLAELATRDRPQVLMVNAKPKSITTNYNTPHSPKTEWWSGSGNNMNNSLSRTLDLTAAKTSASMSAWLQYNLEDGYDYLYAEVSPDGGATWTTLAKYTGGKADASGDTNAGLSDWAQATWDLSAYAGKQVSFRLRVATDGGIAYEGAFVDDVALSVDGAAVFTDTVESGVNGWTAKGWTQITGSVTKTYPQYYLVENRQYVGYDFNLLTGPYNFGWANTRPNWVERFPYFPGLVVWYCDTSQPDNNTSQHPGYGQALPVDAHPTPIVFGDGTLLGNRRQPFDGAFGLTPIPPVTFHRNGTAVSTPWQAGVRVFDDSDVNRYWNPLNPMGSTKVAGSGVKVSIRTMTGLLEYGVDVTFTK